MNKIYGKLARNNIVNNRQLYVPYILSGMMTAALFYVMNFLCKNPGLDRIPGSAALGTILALGVDVIGIFAYIFIFYTNSFISKHRKKELGIYNILGMEKKHIARVLFLETLFVAVCAIGGGLFMGIVFSKLMVMLLYRILRVTETVSFMIYQPGIRSTVIAFGILYLLTFLYNLMQLKLSNPIELLHGSSAGEKEPKTKLLMTLAGIACIGTGYYIAITTKNPLQVLLLFFGAVILVIAGTYFLFTAGSIVFLKLLRKNKNFYYNKKHFTAVSGMLYRMKQNAAGLASICILSTMVLVVISTTVSLFVGIGDELSTRYPYEINVFLDYDRAVEEQETLEEKIRQTISECGRVIEKEGSCREFSQILSHEEDSFAFYYTNQGNMKTRAYVNVMSRDSFVQVDEKYEKKEIPQLQEGTVAVYGTNKWEGQTVNFLGKELPVAYTDTYRGDRDLYMSTNFQEDYYLVVSDEAMVRELFLYQQEKKSEAMAGEDAESLYAGGFRGEFSWELGFDIDGTDQEKIDCASRVRELVSQADTMEGQEGIGSHYIESRTTNEADVYSLYGGIFFLGIFLGSMFLMVTVMIIFYKQISEGYDDRQRYEIMEKVGMSGSEVKASIQSQIRLVFFLPLGTAVVHVAAAFPMVRRLLLMFNLSNTTLFISCLAGTILAFTLIYYVVFRLTSRAYYRIVR